MAAPPVRKRLWRLAAALGLALAATCAQAQQQEPTGPQPTLPVIKLSAGIHVIDAEVADTEQSQRTGLMFRRTMPENHGMLFVFSSPDVQCFWMHNTVMPLSIAFIAENGKVVNVDEMQAQTDTAHCSHRAIRYALEMNKGWFTAHGISEHSRIDGLP